LVRALTLIVLMFFISSASAADGEIVPGTLSASGTNDIAEAWLISPTRRYEHFVRGNDAEGGGLRLRMTDGRMLTLMLDNSHVFEDRHPRLADLDGDGRDEIVLVLTSLTQGSALAVYGASGDSILLKAQTPHIGQPHRWLNPAGIADFDGDGQLDIALVQMPHLVGRLEMWTFSGGGLTRWGAWDGFTNHAIGSPHTGMAAVADFDGDGVADLAIPKASRIHLEVLGFAQRQLRHISAYFLSGRADGEMSAQRSGDGWVVSVPNRTGRTDRIQVEEVN
jgi:hypothetical protein